MDFKDFLEVSLQGPSLFFIETEQPWSSCRKLNNILLKKDTGIKKIDIINKINQL